MVAPVAGGGEQDEEEERAVNAGAVEEVGAEEEEENEDWRGVCWNEEQREPAIGRRGVSAVIFVELC